MTGLYRLQAMLDILNTRELAIGIWLVIFFAFASIVAGRALLGVAKAAIAPQLISAFSLFATYVVFSIFFLSHVGLWDWPQLKTTLLWMVFTAPGMIGRMISKEEHPKLLRGWAKDSLGAAVIVELVTNTYTFPLWGELLLVPFLALIGGMLAVGEREARHAPTVTLLNWVLGLFGAFVIGRGVWMIVTNWASFATLATLRDFYTVPLLSLALIPFLYVMYLYVRYEIAFVPLSIWIKDKHLRDYARAMAFISFNVRPHLLRRWQREIAHVRPTSRYEVVTTIKKVLRSEAREKSPPPVDPREGWCPIAAGKFVAEDGFPTGDYHAVDGNDWFASAPMKAVTEGLWSHNMAFYIDGDERAARELRLKLYVNGTDNRDAALAKFKAAGQRLIERALSPDERSNASKLLDAGAPFTTIGATSVALMREDFPNKNISGYELTLELKRPPVRDTQV